MSDKPILYSAPMVRALLAGTKTQTRRILRSETAICRDPAWEAVKGEDGVWRIAADTPEMFGDVPVGLRIAVGDRLYVREHWRTYSTLDDHPPRDITGVRVWYEADEGYKPKSRFRQGMHMPRWASRITLTVTDVRVQRLQDISEADAIAEGIVETGCPSPTERFGVRIAEDDWCAGPTPRAAYSALWTHVNDKAGAPAGQSSWDRNPWVAAYTFTVELANIDQVRAA